MSKTRARRIVCAGVSSPGLDRKLTKASDFERFRGQRVKLMTREPVNGKRHFEGKLESFENGKLLLDLSAARKKKMRPKEGDARESRDRVQERGEGEFGTGNLTSASFRVSEFQGFKEQKNRCSGKSRLLPETLRP